MSEHYIIYTVAENGYGVAVKEDGEAIAIGGYSLSPDEKMIWEASGKAIKDLLDELTQLRTLRNLATEMRNGLSEIAMASLKEKLDQFSYGFFEDWKARYDKCQS